MSTQRRLKMLAIASVNTTECPDSERLADYILGNLSDEDQLAIAAHVRSCRLCQHLAVICRPPEPGMVATWDEQTGVVVTRPKPKPLLSRLIARLDSSLLPAQDISSSLSPIRAFRNTGDSARTQRYITRADIAIDLMIAASSDDTWRIAGRVTRANAPLSGCLVTVKGRSLSSSKQQETDDAGGFRFEQLPPGRYTLSVKDDLVEVLIRALKLGEDD